MRVAIVGSGIAGLAAAHALHGAGDGTTDIVMFEAAARAGGHVYTVEADGHAIDMGFIVHNRERYPQFCALLDELGIATRPTTMSFSVVHDGLEWGSESLASMFAQRRRLIDPRHWRFLANVGRFLARAKRDLASVGDHGASTARNVGDHGASTARNVDDHGASTARYVDDHGASTASNVGDRDAGAERTSQRDLAIHAIVSRGSLDDYLVARAVPDNIRHRFVVPLAAALWSLAPDRCGDFPALTYLRFLEQHGMLSPLAPMRWHTIVGGSRRYVDALLARLGRGRGRFALRLSTPVARIDRDAHGITIHTASGADRFDRVIVATHADTALRLLATPTPDEQRVLGAFRYSTNRTVLHTDREYLPKSNAAHAAWNYVADRDRSRVAVTYSMTRLQGLPLAPGGLPYLVTLNPRREPRGILHEVTFEHPQFDRGAVAAQAELPELAGTLGTYYAGAHVGFGFHEDGMRSGTTAATRLLADATAREARAS